jgi:hypothetical protein
VKAGFGFEEIDELRKQFEAWFVGQLVKMIEVGFKTHSAVDRFKDYLVIVARFDPAMRQQADREIHGRRAFMKKKKRRNIDSSTGKIYPGWGG